VLSWDAFGSWSNQPLGLNGQTNGNNLAQESGITVPTSTLGYHISTSMSARWRWGKGFIGLQYTPSIDYQTATGVRQLNQNISMLLDHPFQIGKWRLTMGVRTGSANQYSEFYNPPPLIPLLAFQIPITNIDLVGLLNEPEPLQPPTASQLFISTRFFTGQANLALTRQLTARDTIAITVAAQMNHTLDFGQQTGALFNYPQSSGGTASLVWQHKTSARTQWGATLSQSQTFGGGAGSISAQQQTVLLTYMWMPNRRWAFSLGGGPARQVQAVNGASMQSAGNARVSYSFAGSVLSAAYSKGFNIGGFAGGEQSQNLNINWLAPQPRGHKFRYTLTGGYQLAQSVSTINNVPGQPPAAQSYSSGAGWIVNASFSYPVSRSLMFTTNYGYFFQNITGAQNAVTDLQHFQRHLVSMGFHYTFGLQQGGLGQYGQSALGSTSGSGYSTIP
jgi:hypothetical protein